MAVQEVQIEAPAAIDATRQAGRDGSPEIHVQAVLETDTGTYRTVHVSVRSMFHALTAGAVRSIRLGEAKRLLLRQALLEQNASLASSDAAVKAFFVGKDGRRIAAAKLASPDAQLLGRVDAVLRLARLTGDYPVRSVQRAFGLDYDEAKAIVKTARKETRA